MGEQPEEPEEAQQEEGNAGVAGRLGDAAAAVGSKVAGGAKAAANELGKGWDAYPEPEGKAGMIRFGCGPGEPPDCPHYNLLKKELANSYYWSGEFLRDYIFYVANWHPFLGMFFSHPNHPWTKTDRIQMFCVSLAITMVPSAVISAQFGKGGGALVTVLIILFVTIPDIICGVLLYQLSIAESRCPNLARCMCLKTLKGCCMFNIAMMGAASTVICYFILAPAKVGWYSLLVPLAEGKAFSYITWFPIWFLLPCQLGFLDLWCFERFMARRAAKSKAEAEQEGQQEDPQEGQQAEQAQQEGQV